MSIQSPVGTLDIKNATLRVGKLEVSNIQGVDTALNVTRANSVLIYDDQASTTTFTGFTSSASVRDTGNGFLNLAAAYVYWGQKLPNAWVMEFEVDIRSGTSAGPLNVNLYSSTYTGNDGYSILFDDNGDNLVLKYDGSTLATASVSGLFTAAESWQKVVINYERGMVSVSVGGSRKLYYKDVERSTPYTVGEYINFTSSSTDGRKLRKLKITNGSKLVYSGESNVVYTHGSLGIGVEDPSTSLEVSGTTKSTAFVGDGSGITNITSANVNDFGSNVSRIGNLESNVLQLQTEDMNISGKKTFEDQVTFESNILVKGDLLVANTVNMVVSDPIIELGSNNLNTGDLGLVMTRHGATNSNVAVFYDESEDALKLGYTLGGAYDTSLELDSNLLAVNLQGNLEVGTTNLFVDTTTSNVGVGTDAPLARLDVHGTANVGTLTTTTMYGEIAGSNALAASTGAFSGDLEVGTANLFVDTTTSNVGVGTDTPAYELDVVGNVHANYLIGDGSAISAIQSSNVSDFASNVTRIETLETDLGSNVTRIETLESGDMTIDGEKTFSSNLEVGTANLFVDTTTGRVGLGTTTPGYALDVHGTANVGALTATSVSGNGSGLTSLDGSQVTTGTVAAARIADLDAAKITTGTLGTARIPNLDAGKITTGTITTAVDTTSAVKGASLYTDRYIYHEGDTNTYMDFPSNDTWRVVTAGDERMLVNSSGNVGIGTASPATYLHLSAKNSDPLATEGDFVGAHTLTEYLRFTSSGDGGDVNGVSVGFKLGADDNSTASPDGRLDICANDGANAGNSFGQVPNQTIATFLGSGNVGIGTASPGGPLDVVASAEGNYIARFKNNSTSGDQDARIVIETSDADGEAQLLFQTTNESTTHKWNIAAGSGVTPNLQFQYNSDFNGGTTAMTIKQNGDVGIGTASPAQKLDVAGRIRGDTMEMDNYMYHVGDINTYFGFPSNDTFTITTSSSERLRVDSVGYVGIGTTSPSSKLHIETSSTSSGSVMRVNASSITNTGYSEIQMIGPGQTSQGLSMFCNGSGRTTDGGASATTVRNNNGPIILGHSSYVNRIRNLKDDDFVLGMWTTTLDASASTTIIKNLGSGVSTPSASGTGMSGNVGKFTAPVAGYYYTICQVKNVTRNNSNLLIVYDASGTNFETNNPYIGTYNEIIDMRGADNVEQCYNWASVLHMESGDSIKYRVHSSGYTDNASMDCSVHLLNRI